MQGLGGLFSKLSDALVLGGGDSKIGVSIGSSSIKLVELKKSGKAWKLLHFGIIQLPEDSIVNREIVNHIAVVESVKTLTHQLKLKNREVSTALSGPAVIIKRMQVEVPNMKELQEQVFWEAEQYLPFDASEVIMDFQLLSDKRSHQADVLLVAVKRTVVETYMNCVAEGGLRPKIVDIDFFALQTLYEANYPVNPNQAACVVDIGASSIKVVIVHAGVPVFTKDSAVGGRNLTAEIQKHLNLNYADAETLKVGGQGNATPQEVSDLMAVTSENFAGEIKRALDLYNASSNGAPVAFVLLAGGSAKIPDLSRVIEEHVGIPTQIINSFNAITYDPSVFTEEYISNIGPVAAVPVGLAVRAGKP